MTLRDDDVLEEIGRALDVEPSAAFVSDVLTRISRRRMVVRATMSGLAIAASVLLFAVIRSPEPVSFTEVIRVAKAPVVVPPAVQREPEVNPSVPRRVAVPRPAQSDRLMVVTNQMAVLEALWAGHRVMAEETEAQAVEVLTPPESTPIVVEPVRVLPVVIAEYRTTAEPLPIIRRAIAALETK